MAQVLRVEAGLDWLDVTLRRPVTLREEADFAYKVSAAATEWSKGEKREPWGVLGYRGWRQGAFVYGERPTDDMARASGPGANALGVALASCRVHAARLDVACTVWFDEDRPGYAEAFAANAAANREAGLIRANVHIRHVKGFGHGDTAYIGSAKSDRLLRVYDKWRESGDDAYKFAWRFELQLRNESADKALSDWRQAGASTEWCRDVLAGYLVERGLHSFRHMGYFTSVTALEPTIAPYFGVHLGMAAKWGCPFRGASHSLRLR